MKKEMLINCLQTEEIRIAILEDGVLEELYVERASHESYVGNIYKGRVVNIEPSIQAAFVDFGVGRNGFLHVSDVEPAYYQDMEQQHDNRRGGGRDDRGGRGGRDDRGGRGGRDDRSGRGGRDDRGGRPRPPQRAYGDNDAPQRDFRQPPAEPTLVDENAQTHSEAPLAPVVHESAPSAPPAHDGPDIIVEQIYDDEDSFYQAPVEAVAEMRDPPSLEEAWPTPTAPRDDVSDEIPAPMGAEAPPVEANQNSDSPSNDLPPTEAANDEPTELELPADEKEEGEEGKAKRKGARPAKGRTARPKKPRKRSAKDEPEADVGEEPKPRPMESSERRTDEHEPSLGPIEPRPAPFHHEDLRDEDLSFSMAPSAPRAEPRPEPRAMVEPVEEIIVEEEEFVQPEEAADELEESNAAPMEPAIAKIEIDESLEELVEEEKEMEAEDDDDDDEGHERETEEARGGEAEEDFGAIDEYPSRDEGRGEPQGDRGRSDDRRGGDRRPDGRGGDRGGRGSDRGGRGGDRGGRGGDRRPGGRDAGRRPGGRPGMGRPKPHIEDIFKRGQEVLVQVIKEGIGTKGPTLSTYISIAGRYLVLMPGLNRIGVSRKIEDDETRRRLREIMNELKPPRGLGFIIRTAGQDRNRQELQSDLAYLSRLWQVVAARIKKQKSPTEIYKESDMVTRTIRDIFTSDIGTIWVDERGAYEAAKEFMEAVMPRYADRIKFYDASVPMFHKYGIESEIARIQMRHVPLPHGGSIVIDQTEALVAIDVNSGNFRANNQNAEETAYQMNLHAAKEIARQLRLRDLGGVIVNDFIDMRDERHRRGVEKALNDAIRRDRARTKILHISQFGIIEMTRQRIRPSLKRSAFQDCPHCKGIGHVKTGESVSIEIMRMLQLAVNREHITSIDIRVHDDVAKYLLNRKRKEIVALEEHGHKEVSITPAGVGVSPEFLEFVCHDNNGNEVKFGVTEEAPPRPPRRRGH